MSALASRLDRVAQNLLGLPYLKLTRGYDIHDRCRYLISLIGEIRQPPALEILDVGCGGGLLLRYLDAEAKGRVRRYVGIDMRAQRLRTRYGKVGLAHEFHDVDLDGDWRFGAFDLVWCAEVMEHLVDDRALFTKIVRSARPGGTIAITTPSLAFIKAMGRYVPSLLEVRPVQDGGHVRLGYAPSDFRRLAEEHSLQLVRLDGITRTDVERVRRRYRGGRLDFMLANVTVGYGRTAGDIYSLGAEFKGRDAEFWSIAALFRRR
ncbi:MAG TPA: class I SAM-dependent methyltransferase [Alphaproteobacteria bacterium]|nr:class I SAM-dependent methyltransferase [Alphaproteobacteria bacterium]